MAKSSALIHSLDLAQQVSASIGIEVSSSLPIDVPFELCRDDLSPYEFSLRYQRSVLYSKWRGVDSRYSPRATAVKRFHEGEERCNMTNRRLLSLPKGRVAQILHHAKKWLHTVFDESPQPFELDWGPGSTSSCKGKWTGTFNKIRSKADITPELALFFGEYIIRSNPSWAASFIDDGNIYRDGSKELRFGLSFIFDIVPGNRVTFVAKNAKTDRSIAIEPHLNCCAQRAAGGQMSRWLSRLGYSKETQPRRQQEFARQGSIDGSYATIDLAMASDTLASRLVEALLPPRWSRYLNALRSPSYVDSDGQWHSYQKHSSMGNGYTFELETLIFLSLAHGARSLCQNQLPLGVFGDDIAIQTDAVSALIESLEYCGFSVNVEKSFTSGSFRESCGGDFYKGFNVTPIRIRDFSDNSLITLHNAFLSKWPEFSVHEVIKKATGDRIPWVPYGLPGGLWTRNLLLVRSRFNPLLHQQEYRGIANRSSKRVVREDTVSLEHTFRQYALHSTRVESVLTDSPRRCARTTKSWFAMRQNQVAACESGFWYPDYWDKGL